LSFALIDNATLTAVQRVTGDIQTKSKDSVDTDIIALENLIQAILFYDDLLAIDDYKPEFRASRAESFPYIRFLGKDSFGIGDLDATAKALADEISPEIRGGEFADEDFRNLIELLQTHIICNWEISGSIYFLMLKGLAEVGSDEFKKYGNLAASIFSELTDADRAGQRSSSQVLLVDSSGNPITKDYVVPGAKWGDGTSGGATKAVYAFVAALTWLANRSIFYSLVGKHLQADTFLFPVRQAYQGYYISRTARYGLDYTKRIVQTFSTALSKDVIDIQKGGLALATAIDLPIFSAWLVLESGEIDKVIDSAFEVRDSDEIATAREQLREIRNALDNDDLPTSGKRSSKIISDLEASSARIRERFGITTAQGVPVTRLVHIYNTVAAAAAMPTLPDYDFQLPLPRFLRDLRQPRGFAALYRNIANDLGTVWSLGNARDLLGARVVRDESAVVYNPKNEAPRYRYAHSPFKSPM